MPEPTHLLTATLSRYDDDGRAAVKVTCLNDPDDPDRDCRHGGEVRDCEHAGEHEFAWEQWRDEAAKARKHGRDPEPVGDLRPPCRGWDWEGCHVHAYDSTSDENPCGLAAWLYDYTGMLTLAVPEDIDLPAYGTVEWDEDPMFVPVEEQHPVVVGR